MVFSNHPDFEDDIKDIVRRKARQLKGKYGFTSSDVEDLEQDFFREVLDRIQNHDSNKAKLRTFVSRIVDHKIANVIRYRKQQKRDYRREACSINDTVSDDCGATIARHETLSKDRRRPHLDGNTNQQDLSIDLSDAIESLQDELRELLELLRIGTTSNAARELGVPRSTLYDKRLAKLRDVLAEKNLDEYL